VSEFDTHAERFLDSLDRGLPEGSMDAGLIREGLKVLNPKHYEPPLHPICPECGCKSYHHIDAELFREWAQDQRADVIITCSNCSECNLTRENIDDA